MMISNTERRTDQEVGKSFLTIRSLVKKSGHIDENKPLESTAYTLLVCMLE